MSDPMDALDPIDPRRVARGRALSRRHFLSRAGAGLGALALGELLAADGLAAGSGVGAGTASRADDVARAAGRLAHAPRARRVVWLQMSGAPPQHELFDPKPALDRLHGTPCPDELMEGRRLAFIKGRPTLLGSPWRTRPAPSTGWSVSEHLPHLAQVTDRMTLVRSMHTDQFNHAPADLLLFTGSPNPGAGSMGAWTSYGLGSANRDLPTYVVMVSGGSDPTGGKSAWGSGYLPSQHQGVRLRGQGDPVLYVSNPDGVERATRRRSLDALAALNRRTAEEQGDPETLARLEQYELAYRMQAAVPEATDLASEPAHLRELYGADPSRASFANNCLLARRLLERGVRFVQLFDWGWDLHGTGRGDDLVNTLPRKCRDVDRPIAALLLDLERRGLLEDTLVVWCGEFGRTPMNEARGGSTFLGRDHQPDCFTAWLAGAGIRGGHLHGESDELGWSVARDGVSVQDLQATVLHALGLDPFRLSFPFQGLDNRLIGPADGPRVVHEWFA